MISAKACSTHMNSRSNASTTSLGSVFPSTTLVPGGFSFLPPFFFFLFGMVGSAATGVVRLRATQPDKQLINCLDVHSTSLHSSPLQDGTGRALCPSASRLPNIGCSASTRPTARCLRQALLQHALPQLSAWLVERRRRGNRLRQLQAKNARPTKAGKTKTKDKTSGTAARETKGRGNRPQQNLVFVGRSCLWTSRFAFFLHLCL